MTKQGKLSGHRKKENFGFNVVNCSLLFLFTLSCLLPVVNLFAKAVSSETAVIRGEIFLLPREFQLESVFFIITQSGFQKAFVNSVFVTSVGTVLHIMITACAAYAFSRKFLAGKAFLQFIIIFTMLFSGGTIPTFIIMQRLGLMENLWALILPALASPFHLVLMRNYFEGIPDSLEESAKIDGASNFRIFISIMLPLALPCIAALIVFAAVGFWTEYFNPLMYLHKRENYTLQLYLRQLLNGVERNNTLVSVTRLRGLKNKTPMIIQSAAVFLATVPILIVYPFLQKYFVKGISLGAVKG
jgi:putative aldouronate transport system permease protein